MDPDQIILDLKEKYGEWLEHSTNPDRLLSIILAQKMSQLISDIEYLNRRLNHVSRS